MQLEKFGVVQHIAHLPHKKYLKDERKNWFWTQIDKIWGVDYMKQFELVEELQNKGRKVNIIIERLLLFILLLYTL